MSVIALYERKPFDRELFNSAMFRGALSLANMSNSPATRNMLHDMHDAGMLANVSSWQCGRLAKAMLKYRLRYLEELS